MRIIVPIIAVSLIITAAACGPKDEAAEAKTAYGAQQTDCVAKYNTREEIDACRAGVRAAWGLADAGASQDGGK